MATGLLESIDRSTQLAGHNRLALLLFRLDARQVFGINVFKVLEVLRCPPLAQLPGAHPHVRGVVDLRGRVVPVIDLARAIDCELADPNASQHLIVAEFNRSVQAFLVTQVERIVHLDVSSLQPPPGSSLDGYLTAVARVGSQLVEIIDVEKVLAEILGGSPSLSDDMVGEAQRLEAAQLKVLVADDSRVARNQIEKVLNQLGIEAILVADGREALERLQAMSQAAPPSSQLLMVISDIEMPAMDGYRLTTEIRRDPKLRDLYILLHTSLSGGFNNAMVQRVGADRFIAKFNSNELAQAVLDRVRQCQTAVA
ncbi:two-component system, chemotaxis family, response regulator CheV [Solimonas aquatica]|uniref:Two-component system, chemotaxis family, response regulator CheV n=1 Tax=Solimonas aquatica TaxID=489703 RepID=A0A1H9E0L1_9GAMM|nr:chemotaxis protein [Solimonas aquatica]SEQ19205.1 two-component system, chemotaxis family, response regulator CheV [Solimonas aquatica]